MKKIFEKLLLILPFFLIINELWAYPERINPVSSITYINQYLKNGVLICFDIDETLLIHPYFFGTHAWFCSRMQLLLNSYPKKEAFERTIFEWESPRYIIDSQPIEPKSHKWISRLQKKGVHIIAVTSSGIATAERVKEMLKNSRIDFLKTSPSKKAFFLSNPDIPDNPCLSLLFKDGILFLNGCPKDKGLSLLLRKLNYNSQKIVFIDDIIQNLLKLNETFSEIDFKGLLYQSERILDYDDRIANLQRQQLTEISSDNEILNSQPQNQGTIT